MSTLNRNALQLSLLLCVTASACSDRTNTSGGGGTTNGGDTGRDTTSGADDGSGTVDEDTLSLIHI